MRTVGPEPHYFVLSEIKKKTFQLETKCSEHAILSIMATIDRNNTYLTCLSLRTASCSLYP